MIYSCDLGAFIYTDAMNQDQAYTLLTLGINVFLTGAAGSGKTYLINRFIDFCHAHALPLAITASTGIAATHIGGMTLHSWSGMGIRDDLSDDDIEDLISREYLAKRYARTSVLIIDEVSMLSGHFLANLDRLLRAARVSSRPFGGMQIVCVGDFFQLPPVSRSGESLYAFLHPIWEWMEMTPCVLTTQYRQSLADGGADPLLEILSEIRAGDVSDRSHALLRSCDRSIDTDDHTELYTRNITVDAYNTDRLRGIAGTEHAFQMTSRGGEKFVDALKK